MTQDEKSGIVHDLCRSLIAPENFHQCLRAAEGIGAEKAPPEFVAAEVEFALNQHYRQAFSGDLRSVLGPRAIQFRRTTLRNFKGLAVRKRVAMNLQLGVEAIGLSQLGIFDGIGLAR
jgi:hypothetical protein